MHETRCFDCLVVAENERLTAALRKARDRVALLERKLGLRRKKKPAKNPDRNAYMREWNRRNRPHRRAYNREWMRAYRREKVARMEKAA